MDSSKPDAIVASVPIKIREDDKMTTNENEKELIKEFCERRVREFECEREKAIALNCQPAERWCSGYVDAFKAVLLLLNTFEK